MAISSGDFTGVAAVQYCGLLVVLSSGDFTGDGTLCWLLEALPAAVNAIDRFVVVVDLDVD